MNEKDSRKSQSWYMNSCAESEIPTAVKFSNVEELEESAQAFGWHIEYRQLRKGNFSAELTALESEGISFASERFNNHLHIPSEPPRGFIGIFLPQLSAGHVRACGHLLSEGDLIFFPPSSKLEILTVGEIRNETIFLPEAEFQAAARSIAPSFADYLPRSVAILHGDTQCFAAIQHEIRALQRTGVLNSEIAWNLLAKVILWINEASSRTSEERLADAAAAAVARKARVFIEERYRLPIRLADLCAFTGVGLRTLQRSFAYHFQMSPTGYINARRMNAARRDLVTADPSSHTVTSIAMRNGFTHLGRFSVDYRTHFGESPRQTLATKKAMHH